MKIIDDILYEMQEYLNQEVIDTGKETISDVGEGIECCMEIVKRIANEQDNDWILVEEKLPEDGVIVLTCDNHENVHIMKHYKFYEYPFGIGPEHERYYMPKVWRPLPEPYKESEK